MSDLPTFPPRLAPPAFGRQPAPIGDDLMRGLGVLVSAGRMLRKDNGYYSLDGKVRLPIDLARRLKNQRLAVAGFSQDIVPSRRGRDVVAKGRGND